MNPLWGQLYNLRSYFRKTASELNFIHILAGSPPQPPQAGVSGQRSVLTAAPDGVNRNCSPPVGSPQAVKFARRDLMSLLFNYRDEWHITQEKRSRLGRAGGEGRNGKNSGISEVRVAQYFSLKHVKVTWVPKKNNAGTARDPAESAAGPGHLMALLQKARAVQYKYIKPEMQLISSYPPPQFCMTL